MFLATLTMARAKQIPPEVIRRDAAMKVEGLACVVPDGLAAGGYEGACCLSKARPMLMRLSAMTPSPTQRFIPASPL